MNIKKTVATALMGCFAMTGMAFASYRPIPFHPRVNQVNQRYGQYQAGRIRQGVLNGSITPGELGQLAAERGAFKSEERTMRYDDNGHLTLADQYILNRQENAMSRQIYADKH